MVRSVSVLVLGTALAAAAGCRLCGDRGCFTSSVHGTPPCQLTGRAVAPDGYYDSGVATPIPGGAPVVPGTVFPPGPGSTELPYPAPTDLIPARPGVPVQPAIPAPAPAPGDPGAMNLLPPPKAGVPVSGTK